MSAPKLKAKVRSVGCHRTRRVLCAPGELHLAYEASPRGAENAGPSVRISSQVSPAGGVRSASALGTKSDALGMLSRELEAAGGRASGIRSDALGMLARELRAAGAGAVGSKSDARGTPTRDLDTGGTGALGINSDALGMIAREFEAAGA